MITDKLEGNFDSCYRDVINNETFKKFYEKVNFKAQELGCKIAFDFYRSAYWIFNEDGDQNFDEILQLKNYSSNSGTAYYTLVVKYTKGYLGNDTYDREVYEGLDGKPFIIKVNCGGGYSLGSLYLTEPYMYFKTSSKDYTYNGEDLKRLDFLSGFKDIYNSELGYISHFLQEGFELVEYTNSNYWGHFEDNKGVSVFQKFDHEYSTGSGNRAGHCHVYVLQKHTNNKEIYINERGTKFKVIRVPGSAAYFGELIFEDVRD